MLKERRKLATGRVNLKTGGAGVLYWEEEARETAIHEVLGTSVEEEARLGDWSQLKEDNLAEIMLPKVRQYVSHARVRCPRPEYELPGDLAN